MAGTLTISTLSDGTNSTSSTNCIQGSAKAWVNFNGASPGTIRTAYNVSSITFNSTTNWNVNFTNALADANYSVIAMCGVATDGAGTNAYMEIYDTSQVPSASSVRLTTPTAANPQRICVAIFR